MTIARIEQPRGGPVLVFYDETGTAIGSASVSVGDGEDAMPRFQKTCALAREIAALVEERDAARELTDRLRVLVNDGGWLDARRIAAMKARAQDSDASPAPDEETPAPDSEGGER